MKKEIKKEENIVEKYSSEEGFRLWDCLLEIEARQKNLYLLMEEVKEVLTGQAQWSSEVDIRLQRIDPKLILPSDKEFNQTISDLKGERKG